MALAVRPLIVHFSNLVDVSRGLGGVNSIVPAVHAGTKRSLFSNSIRIDVFKKGLLSGKLFDLGYFHWTVGFGSMLYVFWCV